MGQDYQGSISQKNVTFVTETVVETVPGDNYYKVMVFIPTADKATYLTGTPTSATAIWVTSTNYALLTQGLLKTWLAGFFASNSVSQVFLCVFTSLATTYAKYKTYAYFKMTIDSTGTTSDLALAALIKAEGKDGKLSQHWIGTYDDTGAIATTLSAASEDAVIVYHWDTTLNGALCQLGKTLAVSNSTGTPVGNSMDMLQTNEVLASGGRPYAEGTADMTSGHDWSVATGANQTFKITLTGINALTEKTITLDTKCTTLAEVLTEINSQLVTGSVPAVDLIAVANDAGTGVRFERIGAGAMSSFKLAAGSPDALATLGIATPPAGSNLDPTTYGVLSGKKIGYFTLLGNGTLYVALEGGSTTLGNLAAANWVRDYIDYVCEIKSTEMITQLNRFRNNDTYQAILSILRQQLNLFGELGRFENIVVTAPVFSALTDTGDTIIIPNAWEADYVDNVREVTVYGTLYVTI